MLVARANPWICLGLSFAWIALAALSPARHDVAALSVAQIVISNLVMYAVLVVAVLATAGTVRTGVAHGPWHVLKEDVFNPNPAVRPARAVGKGLVTGVALVALSLVVMAVVGLLSESVGCELREQDGIVLLKRGTAAGKAVILFSVVVLTPVAEELFFRYALENAVEGAIGSRARAMAYTSALFALMHGNLQAIPALFLVAAGCSFIYRRTGTLLAPMAAHAIFNLSSVMLVLLGLDS